MDALKLRGRTWAMLLTMTLWGFQAASAEVPPSTLEECYLEVALEKSTADMVHLAREICDAAFGAGPRSLARVDARSGRCEEWWFDRNGRYESATHHCSLERSAERRVKLACQWKDPHGKRLTFVELREVEGRLEPVGEVYGHPLGDLYTSLGACIEQRAKPASAPGGRARSEP